jgi:hypothetical protein
MLTETMVVTIVFANLLSTAAALPFVTAQSSLSRFCEFDRTMRCHRRLRSELAESI